MTVGEVKKKVDAGLALTTEEQEIARLYGLKPDSNVGSRVVTNASPHLPNSLITINRMINLFKFNIEQVAEGYYIQDCRKTPPKRINAIPYSTEQEATTRMGRRILSEFEERNKLWKQVNYKT